MARFQHTRFEGNAVRHAVRFTILARNPDGDPAFLEAGSAIVATLLTPHFGKP
jgi:hypothetical protein